MTIRQKRRAKIIGKNSTTKAELIEAGYAVSTAGHQPPSVMRAKGWKDLMEAHLPDEKLLLAHNEALTAIKIVTSHTEPDSVLPDHAVRLKAVELGYKVKGKLAPEASNNFNVAEMNIQFREVKPNENI